MEIVELPRSSHPFYFGTQFHPEFKSRPARPSPPFFAFAAAAAGEYTQLGKAGTMWREYQDDVRKEIAWIYSPKSGLKKRSSSVREGFSASSDFADSPTSLNASSAASLEHPVAAVSAAGKNMGSKNGASSSGGGGGGGGKEPSGGRVSGKKKGRVESADDGGNSAAAADDDDDDAGEADAAGGQHARKQLKYF